MTDENLTETPTSQVGWLRPSEQPFYRRAEDWVSSVLRDTNWKLTDFLSPRELQILESVARREGCLVASYGGAPGCERRRVYIMPGDWNPLEEDFCVTILSASTVEGTLSHGSVLGSILGTGIDRRKIGDIEVKGHTATLAVCSDIVPFLQNHWTEAGRHAVSLSTVDDAVFHGPQYEEELVSLASMRLDALIGACCHWSRTRAKEAVLKGDVTLNFSEVAGPDETLSQGDIVSVRHFGRIRVYELVGESRKGRLRVRVGVLKSQS